MSRFGARLVQANQIADNEMADDVILTPMREVINGEAEPDPTREGGTGRAVILAPGGKIGSGHSLNQAHTRASASITILYMLRGTMARLQWLDRLTIVSTHFNPEMIGQTYQVADGPTPIGFGRFQATLLLVEADDGTVATKRLPAPRGPAPWDEPEGRW